MCTTVLLVSDHARVRTSVRALLEGLPDVCVVAAPTSVSECLHEMAARRPQIAVIDSGTDGLGARHLVAAIHARVPGTGIIVLAPEPAPWHVHALLDAGARGFLLKETAARELEPALHAVMAGRTYLGDRVAC